MKYKHGKIFKRISDSNLIAHEYSPEHDDYYGFVKATRESGCRQVIITSEIMMKIIKYYFLERHFQLLELELMIEDEMLEDEISRILKRLRRDRGYLTQLLDKLRFLVEESSIDIKTIELKDGAIFLRVQVNGIFSLPEDTYEMESQILLKKVKEYI